MKLFRKITIFLLVACNVSLLHAIAFDLKKIIGDKKSIKLSQIPGISNLAKTPAGKFLKDISIENIKLKVDKGEQSASGEAKFFGQTVDAGIQVGKGEADKRYLSLSLGLPQGFKFSKIDSKLGPLDIIKLAPEKGKNALILSTGKYEGKSGTVEQGINIEATLASDQKAIKGFNKFMNFLRKKLKLNIKPEVTVIGQLTPTIFNSFFSVKLPKDVISLGKLAGTPIFKMGDLGFGIRLKTGGIVISVEGEGELNIPIPKQIFAGQAKKQPFFSMIERGVISLDPAASEVGLTWQNTYNQKNMPALIPLKELSQGISVKLSPEAAEALGIGQIQINGSAILPNGKGIKFGGMIDITEEANVVVVADIPGGMYLSDVVETVTAFLDSIVQFVTKKKLNLAQKIKGKIPKLGIDTGHLSFAIRPDTLGEGAKAIQVPAGLEAELAVNILGVKPRLKGDISLEKIGLTAGINNIKVGPIKFTGSGAKGSTEKGPVISLEIDPKSPLKSGIFADGQLELTKPIKVTEKVHADISPKGVDFEMKSDIKGLGMMDVVVSAPNFKNPKKWKIIIKGTNEAQEKLAKLIKEASSEANKAIQKAAGEIDKAKRSLKPLKEKAANLKRKLDEAKRKCKGKKISKEAAQALDQVDKNQYVMTMKERSELLGILFKSGYKILDAEEKIKEVWGQRFADYYIDAVKNIIDFKWYVLLPGKIGALGPLQRSAIDMIIDKKLIEEILKDGGACEGSGGCGKIPALGFYMGLGVVQNAANSFIARWKQNPKLGDVKGIIWNLIKLYEKWPYQPGGTGPKIVTQKRQEARVNQFKQLATKIIMAKGIPQDKASQITEENFKTNGGTETTLPQLNKTFSWDISGK